MDQAWYEMLELRSKRLANAVWIPLRASNELAHVGTYGYRGNKEEFFGSGSLAVFLDQRSEAETLGWTELGLMREHRAVVQDDRYIPSDVYENYDDEVIGVPLVLEQPGNRTELSEWHLHQDFVIALQLKREGDVWVCFDEGYIEVARLHRNPDKGPYLLEVRAEHLKDYLCARKMALYVVSFRSRRTVSESVPTFSWSDSGEEEYGSNWHWKGSINPIHEGGMPFGSSTAVFHLARTDVDPHDDVPTILGLPSSGKVRSKQWTVPAEGEKLYSVRGELWKSEWIDPAPLSPRIRRDETEPTVFFITDTAGTRESKSTLAEGGRWLWFRPDLIPALAHRRGGGLKWYTGDTGGVSCSPGYDVHFGVNTLGLVTAYAKDIVLLPDWQQRIWAGFNISPEGGVSEELLASQVSAVPADTQAPEGYLGEGIRLLNHIASQRFGFNLFREHDEISELLPRIHRFRATDRNGLLSLAKDLARITADSIDSSALQTQIPPPKGERWGSLKSLEKVLATIIPASAAREIMAPLAGVYELRHADAHLPGSGLDAAFELAQVDQSSSFVFQGFQLLNACVSALFTIAEVLDPSLFHDAAATD